MFRFPGGKNKLRNEILSFLNFSDREYREPFFGGGSIGLALLKKKKTKIWINDKDYGIYCIWISVIKYHELLKEKVKRFIPGVEIFSEFKQDLLNKKEDVIDTAFKKLVVHQLSYSGLGTKGGPLGGKNQSSEYKIDCRWSADYLCKKIDENNNLLNEAKCTNYDFEKLLGNDCFIFLDPPYYKKGNQLYQCEFSEQDHIRLSECLKKIDNWVLSYDDCEEIRNLYRWARIENLDVNYTINNVKKRKELLILSER